MRILFIGPFLPYPPIAGGHAQVWAWLRRLAGEHEVAFVGFFEREEDEAGAEEMGRHCAEVRVRLRRATPHAYTSFAQLPRWVTEFFSSELARDVATATRLFRPDVVQFLSTNMAQYRPFVDRAPSVVTALEIGSVAYRRRIAVSRGLERLQARLDWLRMLSYETCVLRRSRQVVAVSDYDARIVQSMAPGARVTAIPPGVDLERFEHHQRRPVPGTVLYFGHMEHYPNLDGLLLLHREIWPRVLRAYPAARLTVAGKGTREELARADPEALAALERDPSVEVAGFIPDLRSAMDASAAMAAAIRLGGGVRNKVIEAMAAGMPVVTTRRGAEGLSVSHGQELLIADNMDMFAEELVRVLRDADLQARLSQAGPSYVARHHDNRVLLSRLERVLAEAAEAGT